MLLSLHCHGLTTSTTEWGSSRHKKRGKKGKMSKWWVICCVEFAAGGWHVVLQG